MPGLKSLVTSDSPACRRFWGSSENRFAWAAVEASRQAVARVRRFTNLSWASVWGRASAGV